MACPQSKYTGKLIPLEFAMGCGDVMPAEGDWKKLTGFRSKSVGAEWETVDATADDTKGYSRENIATYMNATFSGDGVLKNDNEEESVNLVDLSMFYFNPESTGGQPTLWLRMTYPDITFTGYMLMSNFSRESPTDDLATFTFEASSAPSPFGFMVERTTTGTIPTSLVIVETAPTVAVSATTPLTVTAMPVGASTNVRWYVEVSGQEFASVASNGVVTGIAVGDAVVVAESLLDPAISDFVTVTVTA